MKGVGGGGAWGGGQVLFIGSLKGICVKICYLTMYRGTNKNYKRKCFLLIHTLMLTFFYAYDFC